VILEIPKPLGGDGADVLRGGVLAALCRFFVASAAVEKRQRAAAVQNLAGGSCRLKLPPQILSNGNNYAGGSANRRLDRSG